VIDDPIAILQTLDSYGVRYVVIGGVAGVAHGSPLLTEDLDICYARDKENFKALTKALKKMEARLRGAPDDVPFLLDEKTIEMGDHFTFVTKYGDFDCLGTPAGVHGYGELIRDSVTLDLDGWQAPVASIDDLIRMKRASNRPKDRIAIEILGALKRVVEEE
jgi:hypothetical protein